MAVRGYAAWKPEHISAQLEALTPPELNELISGALEAHLDMDAYAGVLEREEAVRAELLLVTLSEAALAPAEGQPLRAESDDQEREERTTVTPRSVEVPRWAHGTPLTRREIRLQRLWEDNGRDLGFLDRWYHRLRLTMHLAKFGTVTLGLRYFMRDSLYGSEGGLGFEVWMQSKGWIEGQIPGGVVLAEGQKGEGDE